MNGRIGKDNLKVVEDDKSKIERSDDASPSFCGHRMDRRSEKFQER